MLIGHNSTVTYRVGHLFCGIGSGAAGFNDATITVRGINARFVCAGGVDNDVGAIENFTRITGVPGTVLDLFDEEQYRAVHGKAPPPGWREATPADIRAAHGGQPVDVMFLSAPCKGFSGLLSSKASGTDKYQAMNRLTVRGLWLTMEAFKDSPPALIVFENVPRIATRGRHLLDQIKAILRQYGYVFAETQHDCGEIGGLAQSRKRFLLVARRVDRVPNFLYEPQKHRLRGVGEVIGKLPLPGDAVAGIMHRVPQLQWRTWVRLAFVPAGKDWRALNQLAVENGVLRDFGIVPELPLRDNALGVVGWNEHAPLITSARAPGQGRFSVADPRTPERQADHLGVRAWDQPSGVVGGRGGPTNGAYSVADPRPGYSPDTHHNVLRVTPFDQTGGTVTSATHPAAGALSVADPRPTQANQTYGQYGVKPWDATAATVTSEAAPGSGPHSVADPRMGRSAFNNTFRVVAYANPSPSIAGPGGPAGGLAVADPRPAPSDYSSRKYRVTPFDEASRTVIGASTTGDGAFAVADPRAQWGENSHRNKLKVVAADQPAGTITGADRVGSGALSVADPRSGLAADRDGYQTQGHYGVVPWNDPSGAVPGFAKHDRGNWSVADPRDMPAEPIIALPEPGDRLVARIISTDDCWHRPFTTLELAALQSLIDPEEVFELDPATKAWIAREEFHLVSRSDAERREWIGNAVPREAAKGMANTMLETLLRADMGETFTLDTRAIWTKPLALALAVNPDQHVHGEHVL